MNASPPPTDDPAPSSQPNSTTTGATTSGPDVWAPRPPWEPAETESSTIPDADTTGGPATPDSGTLTGAAMNGAVADRAVTLTPPAGTGVEPDRSAGGDAAADGAAPSWGPIGFKDTPGGDQLRRLRDELAGAGARLTGAGAELDGEIERRRELEHELGEARRFARDQYERACRAEDLVAELRTALTAAEEEIARVRSRSERDHERMSQAVEQASRTLTDALADRTPTSGASIAPSPALPEPPT